MLMLSPGALDALRNAIGQNIKSLIGLSRGSRLAHRWPLEWVRVLSPPSARNPRRVPGITITARVPIASTRYQELLSRMPGVVDTPESVGRGYRYIHTGVRLRPNANRASRCTFSGLLASERVPRFERVPCRTSRSQAIVTGAP